MDVQTAIMLFVALLMLVGKIIFNYDNLDNFEPYRNWFYENKVPNCGLPLSMGFILSMGHTAES